MRYYLGIDIGLDGGIAVLNEHAEVSSLRVMPTKLTSRGKRDVDVVETAAILQSYPLECIHLATMEFVHSFGTEARSSMFSFGRSTGKLTAVLELLGIPYLEPTPQAWKAKLLAGTKKDKAAAIGYCQNRWPNTSLCPGKCSKPKDGLADALLLAEFARLHALGASEQSSACPGD